MFFASILLELCPSPVVSRNSTSIACILATRGIKTVLAYKMNLFVEANFEVSCAESLRDDLRIPVGGHVGDRWNCSIVDRQTSVDRNKDCLWIEAVESI